MGASKDDVQAMLVQVLFGGRTIHNSIGLSATSSMKVEHLGLKGKTRTKVEKITVPAAALAIDEVSQMSATMLHANAVRHTYGRAREHGLRVDEYMKVNELFGRMPVVLFVWRLSAATTSARKQQCVVAGFRSRV